MTMLTHVSRRLFNVPLLASPAYLEVLVTAISDRLDVEPMVAAEALVGQHRASRDLVIDNEGTAVMPIVGGMVHRSDSVNPSSGMTGYMGIVNQVNELRLDRHVRNVVLDMDTPGGEVTGVMDAANAIRELAQVKPVWAVANGLIASAGYWLAAGATRIFATPISSIGSIGVFTMHLDRSKEMEKRGQKVTIIKAGAHKAERNPWEELPDDVRASVQKEVDALYSKFVGSVAEMRGLSEAAVRGTEAAVFNADDALELGLVDGIASMDDVIGAIKLARMGTPVSSGQYTVRYEEMDKQMYGASDLAGAREEGVQLGVARAQAEFDTKLNKAMAEQQASFVTAVATVFKGDKRADAFCEAMEDGASVALSAKLASKVEVAPAAAAAAPAAADGTTASRADIAAFMAAHAPGVRAEGGKETTVLSAEDKKAARMAELKAAGNIVGRMNGHIK